MRRASTSCASGSGAVTRKMGSLAKNNVPSGMAWTSPVKRKLGKIVERGGAEPAGALQPVDLVCGEAQLLEEFERLLEPRGNQKAAPGRQLAHEQLEDRRLGLAIGQIGLDHIELVEVGEEGA